MTLTAENIREMIFLIKTFAENQNTEFDSAEHLAIMWWELGQHNGHNDWNILSDDIKNMWVMFASAAIKEIETGEPTPEF